MTEAQKILDMIEVVDPNNSETLDEIDVRVWFYLNPHELNMYGSLEEYLKGVRHYWKGYAKGLRVRHSKVTRSRDALKAIRPEGWMLDLRDYSPAGWYCQMQKQYECVYTTYQNGKTEQLAELYAIIEAIEYERQNK